MIKLKYNDINWIIPLIKNSFDYIDVINSFLTKLPDLKNPIKSFFKDMDFPIVNDDFILEKRLKKFENVYSLEIICSDYYINPNLFYNEDFKKYMDFLNYIKASFVVSNEFLLNYTRKNFPNIKVKSSKFKNREENIEKNEIDYYESLIQRYDKVILDPKYVKTKFLNEYKNYSDTSKFEIIVNFEEDDNSLKNFNNSLSLTHNEMKALIEEVGIKDFRLNLINFDIGLYMQTLFNYIFVPDAKSIYLFGELLSEKIINKNINK